MEKMFVKFGFCFLSLALTTGYPAYYSPEMVDRDEIRGYFSDISNQAEEKNDKTPSSETFKTEYGVWKSSLENLNLYKEHIHQRLTPFTIELHNKLILDSDKLRAQISKELRELQEKLFPYVDNVHQKISQNVAEIQDHLTPYVSKLNTVINQNGEDICKQFNLYTKELESTLQEEYHTKLPGNNEVLQGIVQIIENSYLRVNPVFEEFKEKAKQAFAEAREHVIFSNEDDHKEVERHTDELFHQLVENLEDLKTNVQRGMSTTYMFASEVNIKNRESSGQPNSIYNDGVLRLKREKITEFCENYSKYTEQFRQRIEENFTELKYGRSPYFTKAKENVHALQGDFSAKLSSLLDDIHQNLN
ncbi:apolipoprotein A-IV-like [Erpetoichthys calabaricus]|nr:apolipoprotein A-IV-like [Erpetoichthys calabaricus]